MNELGEFMGTRFAMEIQDSELLQSIYLICPVPLHPKKERKRGYNQSYLLAKGLSDQSGIPIDSQSLVRKQFLSTQTRKTRWERWENVESILELASPDAFEGKHILLIDDVVTTGATLEGCAGTIHKSCQARISVLTLAIA